MEIICDFYHDFLSFCKIELNLFGYSTDGRTDEDVVMMFWKVYYRIPLMKPRKIHKAISFSCPPELKAGLDKLENSVIHGNSLKPFLSEGVDHIDNKRFYDNLLSDWNIHHFHLGTTMRSDGFIERTGNLLFAELDSDNFYEIAILDHNDHWTEKDLLEIINTNWPELTKNYSLNAISTKSNFSNNVMKKFRKNGIQSLVTLTDGKVLAPLGGGYSTDGTPMDVIMKHDAMMATLRSAEKNFIQPGCRCIPEIYNTRKSLRIQAIFSCHDIFRPQFMFSQ